MLGFSWNGTLSRTAVGATLLLLILSYTESRLWLRLSAEFVDGAAILGQPVLLGLFVFLSYALGSMIVETRSNNLDWEKVTAESLALESKELLGLVLEYQARSELLFGLGRAAGLYAGLGIYNLLIGVGFRAAGQPPEQFSPLSFLIPAIVFGLLFWWQLGGYARRPLEDAKSLVKCFRVSAGKDPK